MVRERGCEATRKMGRIRPVGLFTWSTATTNGSGIQGTIDPMRDVDRERRLTMTREQFIEKWRQKIAGVIALGCEETRKTFSAPLKSAEVTGACIFNLAETTQQLLGELYDDLAKTPTNGQPKPANGPMTAKGR